MIPNHQLCKCSLQEHRRIFKDEEDALWYELADGEKNNDEVLSATATNNDNKQNCVPFPQEHHMNLGLELINVFNGEIMILLKPGAGEMLKAVLQKHTWAIAICKDQVQKTLIINNLKEFSKKNNLVNFADAPKKSDGMIRYEKERAPNPSSKPNVIPTVLGSPHLKCQSWDHLRWSHIPHQNWQSDPLMTTRCGANHQ